MVYNSNMFALQPGGAQQFSGMVNEWGGTGGFGDWTKSDMGGLDAWASINEGMAASEGHATAYGDANPFSQYRKKFGQQLSDFMDDPNSITDTPGYKFAFDQGMTALNRTAAAKGGRLGGGVLLDAQKFGQGLASQMRQAEIANLSNLSGANMEWQGGQHAVGEQTAPWQGLQQGMEAIGAAQGMTPGSASGGGTRTKTTIKWA